MSNEKKLLERNALEAFLRHDFKIKEQYTIEERERPENWSTYRSELLRRLVIVSKLTILHSSSFQTTSQ